MKVWVHHYVHIFLEKTLSIHAHSLYINVPDRGQSQVIQSLRRAKFIVPHWRERERERENRLVGVLQPECSKYSDFPSRVVRSIHCYIVAFDSSLIFRQQEVGIVFTIYVHQHAQGHFCSMQCGHLWTVNATTMSSTVIIRYPNIMEYYVHTFNFHLLYIYVKLSRMYNSSESTCVTFILTTLLQRQHPAMYVRQQGVSPPAYLEADPVSVLCTPGITWLCLQLAVPAILHVHTCTQYLKIVLWVLK